MAEPAPLSPADIVLAVIHGDDAQALHLLDGMPADERAGLMISLRRAADIADDHQRCPRCRGWASDPDAVVDRMLQRRWHRACHTADMEDQARRGDLRARAILDLTRHRAQLVELAGRREVGVSHRPGAIPSLGSAAQALGRRRQMIDGSNGSFTFGTVPR